MNIDASEVNSCAPKESEIPLLLVVPVSCFSLFNSQWQVLTEEDGLVSVIHVTSIYIDINGLLTLISCICFYKINKHNDIRDMSSLSKIKQAMCQS
jgi:hypothetical protein